MRWKLAFLTCLLLSESAWAQPQAELRVLDVAAPPGGLAVVVVELTEPQPISKGQMCLTYSPQLLGSAERVVVFSSGSVTSQVSQTTGTVIIEIDSPDSSYGTTDNLPIAVLAFPVLASAQAGQSAQITLDANTELFDPQEQLYPQDVKPGTFTVGGYSVSQMSPSLGLVTGGSKIVFGGTAFPPGLRVDISGAQAGSLQVISPQQAEVTLQASFNIQSATRLRFRDQDNRDLPDKFIYPAIFSASQPAPNSPPVAVTDEVETSERVAVVIEVLANDSDPDGDAIDLVSVTQPDHGRAQIVAQGSVRYTPDKGFQGPDSFAYTIADSKGAQATGTVSVTVLPALLQFSMANLSLIQGTAESISLNLSRQPPAGSIVQLSAVPQGILELPAPIMLQSGDSSLNLTVFATTAGETVLTASAGNELADLAIQALPGSVVEVPVVENTAQAQVGLALTNRSQSAAQVRVRAFAESSAGALGTDMLGQSSYQMPIRALASALDFEVNLDSMSQTSQLLSEYNPSLEGFRGWIELSSTNTALAAMFLNLTGATGGFAGASASPRATAFAFPQSMVHSGGDFEFALVNNNGRPAEVLLTWQASAMTAQSQLTLGPQQSVSRSIVDVFPGLPSQVIRSGYLLVDSSEPLSAYQQRRTGAHLLGQRPPALSNASALLHLPHLVVGPDWFTELSLINPGDAALEAVLRLVDDSLAPLSAFAGQNPVTVVLEPQEQLIAHLDELFALTASEVRVGSLIIEATAPLAGASVIGRDSPLGPTAALPLLASPFSSAVFAQAASGELQGILFFTGLAFQNPQPEAVSVAVQVFSQQGALLGQGEVELPAGERRSRLLSEIIPDLQSFASGYLVVQASQPILMLEIFGNQQLDFLSTVDAFVQ